tara:strand:+ start:37 stop:471 length:435 start_codon:yes stop_codon:yes gene_type:complete
MNCEELFSFTMNPYGAEYSLMDYLEYQRFQTSLELRDSENIKRDINIINNNIEDDYIIINHENVDGNIIPDYFSQEQDIPEEINEQENHPFDIPENFDVPDEIIDYLELGITEIPITHDMLCGDNRDEAALAIQEAWRSYDLYL